MNWLTAQVAGLHYFGGLAEYRADELEPGGLAILPYAALRQTLLADRVQAPPELPLDDYFLLVEGGESAAERAAAAYPAVPEELHPTFTLALDDHKGTVVYLPEDQSPEPVLQLFNLGNGRIGRVRVTGSFTAETAELYQLSPVPDEACSDGACQRWRQGCGEGCLCRRYEVTDFDLVPSLALLGDFPGRQYQLRCS